MDIRVSATGELRWKNRIFRCALGWGGVRADKREGDGATPAGRFSLRCILYRPDRVAPPAARLPVFPLAPDDGWCDDPADSQYNRPVRLPYSAHHEELWRTDSLYDVIAVVGYNDAPVVAGMGSAIFIHLANADYQPTQGCVALAREDLLAVLAGAEPHAVLEISASGAC